MSLINTFLTALRGVAANKLRATLTMLGMVIGVASVIAMLALGNGARAAVEANFRFLGSDQVQISARMEFEDGEISPLGKKLTYRDGLEMPGTVPLVKNVSMALSVFGKVRYGRAALEMTFSGVTADALENLAANGTQQPKGWPEGEPVNTAALVQSGRFFTTAEVSEGAEVCVLGSDTALDLFGGDDPLGQTVRINRKRCTVIGVLTPLESTDPAQRRNEQSNDSLYLPISTVINNFYEDEPNLDLSARVTDESRMDEAKAQINAYLRQRHEIEANEDGSYTDDFYLTTRKDVLGAQQEAARTFSLLLTAMAVISLGVGGIGIMNMMLVSVTERTREIGVRLAIGARPIDIVSQFLLEAVVLSLVGGGAGVVLGVLSIPLAASLNQGQALLEPSSVPLALGVALLTGVLFGLYPALRAARLDPMTALRYE